MKKTELDINKDLQIILKNIIFRSFKKGDYDVNETKE